MSQTNVEIHNEVKLGKDNDWILCFQYCTYKYGDGGTQNGYRFI